MRQCAIKLTTISADSNTRPSLASLTRALSTPSDASVAATPQAPLQDFNAGYALGAADERAGLLNALHALESCTTTLKSQLAGLEALYRKECAALLAQILKTAIPTISEAAARAAIARLFDEATGNAPPADVAITAAPDIHDALQPFCRQFDPPISMHSDPLLAPGALQARWKGGGLECDVARSLFAIVEMLNSNADQTTQERN